MRYMYVYKFLYPVCQKDLWMHVDVGNVKAKKYKASHLVWKCNLNFFQFHTKTLRMFLNSNNKQIYTFSYLWLFKINFELLSDTKNFTVMILFEKFTIIIIDIWNKNILKTNMNLVSKVYGLFKSLKRFSR